MTMTYEGLPAVGELLLPELEWKPTAAETAGRQGEAIEIVFVHRWGIGDWRGEQLQGIIDEFENPARSASAHLVYAGEKPPHAADAGRCIQMVGFSDRAWTEAGDNARGVSIETADTIWLNADPRGFARLARIVAFLATHFDLPVHWQRDPNTPGNKGIARHADGGQFAGGHTQCPTIDLDLWQQFMARVQQEAAHGGFRPSWGR
jgi:N-acetylmuramoyl-L-alanine amidase-like protein